MMGNVYREYAHRSYFPVLIKRRSATSSIKELLP